MSELNTQLVLVSGFSSSGKSASLRNLKNQNKWFYLNCEAGKALPFANKFKDFRIEDPYQVLEAFDYAIDHPDEVDGIIIDSLTFLLDMYESQYVIPAADGRRAWQSYNQFFKTIMQDKVIKFNKPTIILAHVQDFTDESTLELKTYVPVKGALKNQGCEAYFSTVVSAKRVNIKDLKDYKSSMLNITEDEEIDGFKYVFQTRLTKKTVGERIRSPMGMFKREETVIDNDCRLLLDHIKEYYNS